MTVYLCGPMEGLSDSEMTVWRKRLTEKLEGISDVKDPCRRKKFHDQPYSMNLAKRITTMDLQDIDKSDLVFANFANERHIGRGSSMEVMYAAMKGKIVITVVPKGYNHPFLDHLSTEVHTEMDEAIESTINYYR